ncbi:MAG: Hsp70 family protein [Planctomycetia bacterium]|nr:Hsp70 family protein [Planctomycetia bacterium]
MAKRRVLGIDLGTTYSCVAYVNDYGKAEVLLNQRDERTTPSVVWFDGDRVSVGQEAKEMSVAYPDAVCSFIKRQMGKDDYTFDVGGVQYSPEHISSLILKKLVQDASARLGEKVTDVVITCPAYFFVKERNATKLAGEMAGLNVLQIVNEPTAAAVDYGIQEGNETKTILVYDIGGGTFDVTVMKVSPEGLDVVCTDGDHQLGGKDWDDALARYFAQRFEEETGAEIDLASDTEFYYDLMQQAEETKKHLSSKTSVSVRLSHEGQKVKFDMTREQFESLTESLLERTIAMTTECLYTAQNQNVEMPSQIILVGGSSKMPQVPARIFASYDIQPELFDPDEAVAKGAAIIGNNFLLKEKVAEKLSHGNAQGKSRSLILDDASDSEKQAAARQVAEEAGISAAVVNQALRTIRNVSSKTFGAIATDPDTGYRSVCNIIYRNTPLPCEVTQTFQTSWDNQENALVELMENLTDHSPTADRDWDLILSSPGSPQCFEIFMRLGIKPTDDITPHKVLEKLTLYTTEENSVKLWEGELPLGRGLRAGSPVDLTYILDENGFLTVIATDQASGNQIRKTIQTESEQKTAEFQQASQKSRSLIID